MERYSTDVYRRNPRRSKHNIFLLGVLADVTKKRGFACTRLACQKHAFRRMPDKIPGLQEFRIGKVKVFRKFSHFYD